MKKHTEPLSCGTFYHIYNRGINGEDLFKEERNYAFFLKKYAHYITPVAETYAYCLMKNHFHLLVRTRPAEDVILNVGRVNSNVGRVRNPSDVKTENPDRLISNQFSKLFNSYAQAINKSHHRTGGLFEELFRRIPVTNESYFLELVYYIHLNPQRHGFVDDFREYPHSSYHSHLSKSETRLNREELLRWFGGVAFFEQYHHPQREMRHLDKFAIEFD